MGKRRLRRALVVILSVILTCVCVVRYRLPQLIERAVPPLAERFGIRSDILTVTAASTDTVSLGPLRQCFIGEGSTICLEARAAELQFTWSLLARSASIDAVHLTDPTLLVIEGGKEPTATSADASPSGPLALPNLIVRATQSGGAREAVLNGTRYPFEGEFHLSGPEQTLKVGEGALSVNGERIELSGTARLGEKVEGEFKVAHRSGIAGTIKLNADGGFKFGTITSHVALTAIPFVGAKSPYRALDLLQLDSGELNATGTFSWGEAATKRTVRIDARELAGTYGPCGFRGFSGTVMPLAGLDVLMPLQVKSVNCGVEVRDLRAEIGALYDGPKSVLRLKRLQAALIGGWVGVAELTLGNDLRIAPLEVRDLSLADLVSLHKQDYIEAAGSLDATVPISRGPSGFTVRGGTVSSKGEGWIKYHGAPMSGETEQSVLGVTERALREYRYTSIAAQIDYAPDGKLTIAAQLRGSSPALNTDRPVHVNLALEENLLELFKSLQIAKDIERQLQGLR